MLNSRIIATGSYLPEKVLTNDDLSKIVDTSNEWIIERTGIQERRIAADNELTSDLAYFASVDALNKAGFTASDIDGIVLATTTPDRTFPSTASILQNKLGLRNNCLCFDVQAVCCGFMYAFATADSFIKTGMAKRILVVGAETMSRIVDWNDRGTCILFGDGAGAVILEASTDTRSGILSSSLHCDGQYFDLLKTSGGASYNREVGCIEMHGKEVFKLAVNKMADSVQESLSKAGLNLDDINFLIPHQANKRIINSLSKKLNISEDHVVVTIDRHGNTSSASVPLALDYALQNNLIKSGDVIVLEALGGGLTWGSSIVRM